MKKYILAFMACVSVGIIAIIVMLTISIPQDTSQINMEVEKYEAINKEEFLFEETKDVEITDVEKEYDITADELSTYIKNYSYIPGNRNPFTPKEDIQSSTSGGNDNNSGSDSGGDNSGDNNNNSGNNDDNSGNTSGDEPIDTK